MNKDQKNKLTLENLEQVVEGKKLKDDSELDDATKATLELAREMSSWSRLPSKEFKEQLKAQVIHQLAEYEKREAKKSGNLEFWDNLRRPAWKLTIAAAITVIIAAIIFIIITYAYYH